MPKPKLRYLSPRGNVSHFYASSAFDWRTSPELPELIEKMKALGNGFDLWYVPLPKEAGYAINNYRPDVEGVIFLGTWEVTPE